MKRRGKKFSGLARWVAAGLTTGLLVYGTVGCKSKDTAAPIVGPDGQDPAAANMAQPYTGGDAGGYSTQASGGAPATSTAKPVRVLGTSQSYAGQVSGEDYSNPYGQQEGQQPPAPIIQQAPDPNAAQGAYNQGYTDAEEAGAEAIANTDQAPPPLPVYDQPPAPDPNYLWTPGYWNYGTGGYYWVPGVWVAPPYYGALWTPPWWGFYGGHYRFYRGYWGPHVGFYGGINYGFGYIGTGYYGGYWRGHDFYYNRAVTNVNVAHVHDVYDRTVVVNNHTYGPRPENRVDFDGGRGGLTARPSPSELGALHEAHYAPVAAQRENRVAASQNHGQFFGANGGRPATAFAARPAGSTGNIAATPREQAFNHPETPGVGGRQGGLAPNGTPGARPGFEANRGVPNGAAGAGARPGFEANRGALNSAPNAETRQGLGANRGAATGTTHAGARQGFEANRDVPRAGTANQGTRPEFNGGARPGEATGVRSGTESLSRPTGGFNGVPNRSNEPNRPAPAEGGRTGFTPNSSGNSGSRPEFNGNHGGFPGSAGAGARPQPAAPPVARPEAAPRPEPTPRPEVPAPRSAPAPHMSAPAAAPHPGGGGAPHGGGGHH